MTVSQHSYGNALDIRTIFIDGHGPVSVEDHWRKDNYPWIQTSSRYLVRLAERLDEARVFTNILTPDYDEGHRNHFHVDLEPPTPRMHYAKRRTLSDYAPLPVDLMPREEVHFLFEERRQRWAPTKVLNFN
jgi:hypothetical protein